MTFKEAILTVCLHTSLPCEEVNVSFRDLNDGFRHRYDSVIDARAYMTNLGNVGVWIDVSHKGDENDSQSTKDILEIAVHEVAHMVTFRQGHLRRPHGHYFRKNCFELAEKVGVNKIVACKAAH